MENPEEVLQILERYTKLKPKEIPQELEEYLAYVAKTGDTVYRWPNIKYLFREKLVDVIKQFHDSTPCLEDLPQYPNVDPFNYETMKNGLLERLDTFNAAPFTIQRISELLSDPRKQYTRIDKFMRAVEKNILVVSTIEPGRKTTDSENGDSLDSMVNGDLPADVDVDIDMSNTALPSINTLTSSAAVIMAEVAAVAKFVSSASKSPTPEDNVNLPDTLEVAPDTESEVVNITDSIEKLEEATSVQEKPDDVAEASTSSPLLVIKQLESSETQSKRKAEENENPQENTEVLVPTDKTVPENVIENVSEDVEKTDSDNSNVTISSSSSDDSNNSTDENECLTGQGSDVEDKTIPVATPVLEPPIIENPIEETTLNDPTGSEVITPHVIEVRSEAPGVVEEVQKREEVPSEPHENDKIPQQYVDEKIPEQHSAESQEDSQVKVDEENPTEKVPQTPPIAFQSTDTDKHQVADTSDRSEDGEPVCKKLMENEMLIEVPPALPLEDIPHTTPDSIDVVSQMVDEEGLLVSPNVDLPKMDESLVAVAPIVHPDLILPLEVAEMEVAPLPSDISEMATEDDNLAPKTDDAMEVDESSMEPMDQ
uniref:Putative serine/threonine-protein phosphatase 4 regulatory subunit 2 isoform x1 n=1 Tax=Nyssomyia neivai TaxID=330878 RepID=A0A1L8DL82_9DIPT